MGTTAEKLTYLNTTKTKIKDAINLANTSITNETFRLYEEKIKQAIINTMLDKWKVWDNFDKVTGSGTDLTLNNTHKAPLKLDLKGNTYQYSTTGKNKFNVNGTYTTENGAIVSISNNKLIQTNGGVYCRTLWKVDNLIVGQEYTLSYDFINQNSCSIQARIYQADSSTLINSTETTTATSGNQNITFTSSETTQYIRLYSNTTNTSNTYSVTFDNIQLEQGSSATSYEPYTGGSPAPSPSYPFDIHNVSGDNTIEICGKNIANWIQGNVNAQGNYQSSTEAICTDYIPVNYNDKFTASKKETFSNANDNMMCRMFDKDKNILGSIYGLARNELKSTFTINNANCKYMRLSQFKTGGIDVDNAYEIMVEKGEVETPIYEAYTGNSQLISLGVENLFDKDNANLLTAYFSNIGTISSTSNVKTLYISCNSNTTYTISKIASTRFRIITTDTTPNIGITGTNYSANDTGTTITITTNANAKYLCVFYYNGATDTKTEEEIRNSIQIEKGSKKNSYSPYGASYIELNKISTYQDYIYKENDIWFLHKEIGKVVLDGSENSWTNQYTNAWRVGISDIKQTTATSDNSNIISNYYKTYSQDGMSGNNYGVCNRANQSQIIFKNTDYTQIEDFKNWLSTHNTIVYYVLATPTDTKITDYTLLSQLEAIYNAISMQGVTNILQENNDLPFNIDATALEAI